MTEAAHIRRPFSLEGRVALVTGAGRGLGFEMARALALSGATVIINGRDEARLRGPAEAIAAEAGRHVETAAFDVADTAAASAAITDIDRRFGRLDILVNNVGMRDRRPLKDFTATEMQALLGADLIAPALLARDAAELMARHRHGRIINISSIAAAVIYGHDAVYSAAKAGLNGLTRALAVDYARAGITANAIAPGMFATETNQAMVQNPDLAAFVDLRVPVGRWGRPAEIGAAAVFLASDEASFVNGHILVVDGGQTVRM
ncbi:SDR family oxidoreductase [Ancylobacter radicis]|uniref:SDR family oxidoreductase n=1 Tax=Ancylobacter radicis TaxID=2836179 RepID=A0ABS5R2Z2_9HYPH|nr:SDR family oxidoreductase [Ancylobacter radicis]MBS9475976.1 SDR family oxidoreductase [Ancylobacter radicis]